MSAEVDEVPVLPAVSYGDEWAQLDRLQSLLSERHFPPASINVMHSDIEYVAMVHIGQLILGTSYPHRSEKQAVKDVIQVVLTAFDAISAMFEDTTGSIYGNESWPPFFRTRLGRPDESTQNETDTSDLVYSDEELSSHGLLDAGRSNDNGEMGQEVPSAAHADTESSVVEENGLAYALTNGADSYAEEPAIDHKPAHSLNAEAAIANGDSMVSDSGVSGLDSSNAVYLEMTAGGDAACDADATTGEVADAVLYNENDPIFEGSLACAEEKHVEEMTMDFMRLSTIESRVNASTSGKQDCVPEEENYTSIGGDYIPVEEVYTPVEGNYTSDEVYYVPTEGDYSSEQGDYIADDHGDQSGEMVEGIREVCTSGENASYPDESLIVDEDPYLHANTAEYTAEHTEEMQSMSEHMEYSKDTAASDELYIPHDSSPHYEAAAAGDEYIEATWTEQYIDASGEAVATTGDSMQEYTETLSTEQVYVVEDHSSQYYTPTEEHLKAADKGDYILPGVLNGEASYPCEVARPQYPSTTAEPDEQGVYTWNKAIVESGHCSSDGNDVVGDQLIKSERMYESPATFDEQTYSPMEECNDEKPQTSYSYHETTKQYVADRNQQSISMLDHNHDSVPVQPDSAGPTCDVTLEQQSYYEEVYEGAGGGHLENVSNEVGDSLVSVADGEEDPTMNVQSVPTMTDIQDESVPRHPLYSEATEEVDYSGNQDGEGYLQNQPDDTICADEASDEDASEEVPIENDGAAKLTWAQIVNIDDEGYLSLQIEGAGLEALRKLKFDVDWEGPVYEVVIGQWYMAPRFPDPNSEPSWERAILDSYDELTSSVVANFADVGVRQQVLLENVREIRNLDEVSEVLPQAELVAVKDISGSNLSESKLAELRSLWMDSTNPRWVVVLNTTGLTTKYDEIPQVQLVCSVTGEVVEPP